MLIVGIAIGATAAVLGCIGVGIWWLAKQFENED